MAMRALLTIPIGIPNQGSDGSVRGRFERHDEIAVNRGCGSVLRELSVSQRTLDGRIGFSCMDEPEIADCLIREEVVVSVTRSRHADVQSVFFRELNGGVHFLAGKGIVEIEIRTGFLCIPRESGDFLIILKHDHVPNIQLVRFASRDLRRVGATSPQNTILVTIRPVKGNHHLVVLRSVPRYLIPLRIPDGRLPVGRTGLETKESQRRGSIAVGRRRRLTAGLFLAGQHLEQRKVGGPSIQCRPHHSVLMGTVALMLAIARAPPAVPIIEIFFGKVERNRKGMLVHRGLEVRQGSADRFRQIIGREVSCAEQEPTLCVGRRLPSSRTLALRKERDHTGRGRVGGLRDCRRR